MNPADWWGPSFGERAKAMREFTEALEGVIPAATMAAVDADIAAERERWRAKKEGLKRWFRRDPFKPHPLEGLIASAHDRLQGWLRVALRRNPHPEELWGYTLSVTRRLKRELEKRETETSPKRRPKRKRRKK